MAPIQACMEFCINDECEIVGCSTSRNMNFTKIDTNNNAAINATHLPCLEKIVLGLSDVPFAMNLTIIILIIIAIIVYAIAKKRLYRNGNL